MPQPNDIAPWDRYEDDGLTDPLDDGSGSLGPFLFDPLCELAGETWPKDAYDAMGYEYEIAHW